MSQRKQRKQRPDKDIRRALRILEVEKRIITVLAPLSPEKRGRVLRAVAILHGLEVL